MREKECMCSWKKGGRNVIQATKLGKANECLFTSIPERMSCCVNGKFVSFAER